MLLSLTVCASVGGANTINKLSLVEMQLLEKYKENFEAMKRKPFVLSW
jgi:hypothetical protein